MPKIVRIAGHNYNANEGTPPTISQEVYLVIRIAATGRLLWIHKRKSIVAAPLGAGYDYCVSTAGVPSDDAVLGQYFAGTLTLYRGVSVASPAAPTAKVGKSSPKPTATLNEPHFTSDASDTRYVPFSTSRLIAVNYAKSSTPSAQLQWLQGDEKFGYLITVQNIGTTLSICFFDQGEIQLLDPPQGTPSSITPLNSLVGDASFADSALGVVGVGIGGAEFAPLIALVRDARWDLQGSAFIGTKPPDGILAMRQACNNQAYWDIFRIAHQRIGIASSSRSNLVTRFYSDLNAAILVFLASQAAGRVATLQQAIGTISADIIGRFPP